MTDYEKREAALTLAGGLVAGVIYWGLLVVALV